MLTRYRLVNVEGLGSLATTFGTFRLDQINDEVAAKLAAQGSRYVEPLPEPELPPPAAAPAPEEAPKRRKKA